MPSHPTPEAATLPHAAGAPVQGGRLVAVPHTLPLRACSLRADACGGLARVVLAQRFVNPWPDPLRVVYRMPLPVDGAVSAYAFRVGERRIEGEVDRKRAARERFEAALAEGRTAAHLEEERPNLFTQEIGNVPPGAELTAEITIDQPLAWLDEGAWEWRFPTAAAPRYLGGPGVVPDAARVQLDVADGPLAVKVQLALSVRDPLRGEGRPASPSHPLRVQATLAGHDVELAEDHGAALDRDLVVRWPVGQAEPGLSIDVDWPAPGSGRSAFGLVTVVPPGRTEAPVPRDLIVLLDVSGSMEGEPLRQARRVAAALVDGLGGGDQLELVAFGSSARAWLGHPVAATAPQRARATAWLASLRAGGGTEMGSAVTAALAPLRPGAQRQVVVITDGQIGDEEAVVRAVLERLPPGSRLHAVGIGSAVNRALTGPIARAGRGREVVIGLGEDVEPALARLLAGMQRPALVDLALTGDVVMSQAPSRLADVLVGAPLRLAVQLSPTGGALTLRGRTATGAWSQRIDLTPPAAPAGREAVRKLWARELVGDLEMQRLAGEPGHAIDRRIEEIGLTHQIATRLTSWVAIDRTPSVDPTAPTREERIPQALPFGQSLEGLGLRAPTMAQGRLSPGVAARMGGRGADIALEAPLTLSRNRTMGSDDVEDLDTALVILGEELYEGAAGAPRDAGGIDLEAPSQGELPGELVVLTASGRLTRREERAITVEVTLAEDATWVFPTRVVLYQDGAPGVLLVIDEAASTREGPLAAGQVLRVRLIAASPIPAGRLRGLMICLPDGRWLVDLPPGSDGPGF